MKFSNIFIQKYMFYVLIFTFLLSGCATKYVDISLLSTEKRVSHNEKVFDKVWILVNKKYFDPTFNGKNWVLLGEKYRDKAITAKNNKALYDEINKMLGELDTSHLHAYMTELFENRFRTFREPVLAGFIWQAYEGSAVITHVFPGSLAEKAGVKKGWLLVKINGESPFNEKVDIKPGEEGYKIQILDVGKSGSYTFLDQAEQQHSVTLTPVKGDGKSLLWLKNPGSRDYDPVDISELPGGYIFLHVRNFESYNVISSINSKLNAHINAPGFILDLRYNTGGKEGNMKKVLSFFFHNNVNGGTPVLRTGMPRDIEIKACSSACYTGPIVILANRSTFSAAEIFTHVVQYYHRATVVGRPTGGSVLAGLIYNLPGGGKVQIPEQDYIGLDGLRIEGKGVTPDVAVQVPTLATIRDGRDLDIEAAMQIFNEKKLK